MNLTSKHTKKILLALCSFALVTGCQSPGLIKSDPNNSSESSQHIAKAEVLVPQDPELDRAEAEFEQLIKQQNTIQKDKPVTEPLYYQDVWAELSAQFHWLEPNRAEFQDYLPFYLNNIKHLERVSVRAKPYLHFIKEQIRSRNMPYELALLPIIESAYYPYAHSKMQAAGLWQFIPSTGRLYGLQQNWWFDGRQDVHMSTLAALDFLQYLYELNNQDWLLALASYNAGYGRIQSATRRLKRKNPDAEVNYWNIRPYLPRETRHYVPQLLAVSYLIKNHQKHNIALEPIPNKPYLAYIELDRQVDLNKVASSLNVPFEIIKHLNPGYLKNVTPPNGPHHLLIPLEHKPTLEKQLVENQTLFDIRWQRHLIKEGDNLGYIAQKYKTSVTEIQRLNKLKGHMIRTGKTLLIPIPAKNLTANSQFAELKDTSNTKSQAKITHQVKAGESLWTIARYYGVETKQLADWNGLKAHTPIQIGQKLTLYSNGYGQKLTHKVKPGESLWIIARRYQVSIDDITRWNNIRRNTPLQPGDKLTIWRGENSNLYTVKTGDTLWDIAQIFNINSEKLKRYNSLTRNEFLTPGQILRIPNDS